MQVGSGGKQTRKTGETRIELIGKGTLPLLARVRLTADAKAQNFDHRLDEQVGTVYASGELHGVPWAEVAWERRCSWHKAADLEPAATVRS